VAAFSLNSLTKRLRVVGLPAATLQEITERGHAAYRRAWDEYEELHSEEHPYRFYDRMAASAG
jgi:hypothetical protein